MDRLRGAGLGSALLLLFVWGCRPSEPEPAAPPPSVETVWVEMAGELFELELAADPAARHRGLSGRRHIPPDGGMLFAFPDSRPLSFVMRDCPIPIDLAFLDEDGRILAIHAMQPEAPRGPRESPGTYEARLRGYGSGGPARFALETAGGRLAELGVGPGQRAVFDTEALARRAR